MQRHESWQRTVSNNSSCLGGFGTAATASSPRPKHTQQDSRSLQAVHSRWWTLARIGWPQPGSLAWLRVESHRRVVVRLYNVARGASLSKRPWQAWHRDEVCFGGSLGDAVCLRWALLRLVLYRNSLQSAAFLQELPKTQNRVAVIVVLYICLVDKAILDPAGPRTK